MFFTFSFKSFDPMERRARSMSDDDAVEIFGTSVDQQMRADYHESRAAVKREDAEFAQEQANDVAVMQDGERCQRDLALALLQKCLDEQRPPLQQEVTKADKYVVARGGCSYKSSGTSSSSGRIPTV